MSDSIQRTSVGDFPISQTVTVPASASLIFVSGTLPDLHDASAPAGTPAAYGNTEVQTVSVFNKIRQILQQQRPQIIHISTITARHMVKFHYGFWQMYLRLETYQKCSECFRSP
jgi:enamine deaminase RidA (YjgF/YER057c/UK114 family)